jgi:hypothetical protein
MPVPEASVHEDRHVPVTQSDVGRSWKVRSIAAEPMTETSQGSAHSQLRRGIAPPDPRHDLTANGLAEYVCQGSQLLTDNCAVEGRPSSVSF